MEQNNFRVDNLVQIFEQKFHLSLNDPSLVITALKHRSYLNVTNEERVASNERLEFLGDAVLDLVTTHYLYQKFPKRTEGQLSKIKSILVSKPVLAETAEQISLGELILINKGEEKSGGRHRQSNLANTFEAVIGAIYLDRGLETVGQFIHEHLLSRFKTIMQRELYKNYKSILLEYVQAEHNSLPEYRVINESGPDHDKQFIVAVYISGKKAGEGRGKSKKKAEQEAAKVVVKALKLE
ncbi:ribonuclease III [candidate division KSB1 bacterium 4484_188]|nr:MAG: ribonuclease III [candidate division KSB1 bacterium 4484_188]